MIHLFEERRNGGVPQSNQHMYGGSNTRRQRKSTAVIEFVRANERIAFGLGVAHYIEYDIAQASSLLVVTADPYTTAVRGETHSHHASAWRRAMLDLQYVDRDKVHRRTTCQQRARKGQRSDLRTQVEGEIHENLEDSIHRSTSNPPAAHRAPREVMRPLNSKTGPMKSGSSGWTRTSNPPVNRLTQVVYLVGSSWV